jgi:uncharacterized membrane protein YvbJ
MKCTNCGQDNREGIKFCENCGNPLDKKVNKFCPSCGSENREGVKFCEQCGTALTAGAGAIPPGAVPTGATGAQTTPTPVVVQVNGAQPKRRFNPLWLVLLLLLVLIVFFWFASVFVGQGPADSVLK